MMQIYYQNFLHCGKRMKEIYLQNIFRKWGANSDQHYSMIIDRIKPLEMCFKHLADVSDATQFIDILFPTVFNRLLKIKNISLT